MAGNSEDAATVLEMFVNDVANLPAEIAHIYEELQAKDKLLKEQRDMLNARDNSLQKHIRQHGSLTEHPKEAQYVEQIRRLHRAIMELQDEKLVLCQKAVELMDKHAKRLDLKMAELVRDGQLQQDALQITPAQSLMPVHSNQAQHVRQPSMRPSPSIHLRTPSMHATPNMSSMASPSIAGPRTPGTDTPSDPKRRRLNGPNPFPVSLQNLPSMPPSSIPGIAIPRVGTPGNKPEHHMRGTTPSGHSGIKKASAARRRRAEAVRLAQQQQQREESLPDEEDDEDEDDDEDQVEDKRLYCMCQQVSYGSMVGCDDKDCPFEWFHWGCVGLTEEPSGKWFCPTCRVRREKTKGTRG